MFITNTVQSSELDFIFGVGEVLKFLGKGCTVPGGTCIMTGTPAGVGWFQEPKYSLKEGDDVVISFGMEGKGEVKLRHGIKFLKGE